MKKLILSPLFCFALLSLHAQDTWNVQMPSFWPYHLGKTNDGNLLLVGRKATVLPGFNKGSHYMIKYNLNGELLWEKEHDFGFSDTSVGQSGGVYAPHTLIQAPSGNFISSGLYNESGVSYCYNFITNEQGDSLFFQKLTQNCTYPKYLIDNKLYQTRGIGSTGY